MNIAFLAHDKKKELMVQFCTAYKSVLMKHNLFATATTGRLIADNTRLPITLLLSHKQGNGQTGIVRNQTAGGGRGKQIVDVYKRQATKSFCSASMPA